MVNDRLALTKKLLDLQKLHEECRNSDDELDLITAIDCNLWMADVKRKLRYMDRADLEGISEEDIQCARNVPITDIVDFNKGRALAWCHADKSPSLVYWREENKARCFVCDKTFNPVDVLISRDGRTFREAVRILCKS